MNKQLTLTEDIKDFLNNDQKVIWDMILEDKITELVNLLSTQEISENLFNTIVKELFTESVSETLQGLDMTELETDCSILMKDLICLILVLDINGKYEDFLLEVEDKVLDSYPALVANIQEQANGYPRNPINGMVWIEAAGLRSGLGTLLYYYQQKDNLDDEHLVTMLYTQITLAIMGHYKELVGPDMLRAAKIKEKVGQPDVALSFYNAVKADFENELDWFLHSPEAGPSEEDRIILYSLKEAYISIDRLVGESQYEEMIEKIDEVLRREYIEEPDEDEEE